MDNIKISEIIGEQATTTYHQLPDKPAVNGVTLQGDLSDSALHLQHKIDAAHKLPAELVEGIAPQVQSDWEQSDSTVVSFILNKPEIPAAQVQSDWSASDSGVVEYIRNKPKIPSALSDLTEDFTHQTVTSAQKTSWNGKAEFPSGQTANKYLGTNAQNELAWKTVPEPQYPVTSVNNKTGAVNITASDVNAISRDGWQITELDGTAVQEAGKVYEHTLAADEVFTFFTPVDGMTNAFELDLTQPATAVSFTLPAVTWLTAVPVFTTANKTYRIMFHRQGSAWMATDLAQQDLSAYAKLSGGNSFSGTQFFSEDMVFGGYGSSKTSHAGQYILNNGWYAGISVGTGAKITSSWGGVALGASTSCLGDSGAAFGVNAAAEAGCVVVGITLKSVGGNSGFYIGGYNGIKFVTNATNDTKNQFMAAQMLNNGNFNFLYDISVSGTLTFNTTGGTSSTLQALEERVAALEQAQS